MIAYVELKDRVGNQPTLTIEQVNDYLSRMSSAPSSNEMKAIYAQMITYAVALTLFILHIRPRVSCYPADAVHVACMVI